MNAYAHEYPPFRGGSFIEFGPMIDAWSVHHDVFVFVFAVAWLLSIRLFSFSLQSSSDVDTSSIAA